MSEAVSHADRLQREIQSLTTPLRTHYKEIEVEIKSIEQEIEARRVKIAELRKSREKVRQVIRLADPDFEPRPYKKNGQGPKKRTGLAKYSSERVTDLTRWIQDNAEMLNAMSPDGFYATQVVEIEGVPITSQSGLSAALKRLHETGVVRLVKQGGSGGRKYYKVVA